MKAFEKEEETLRRKEETRGGGGRREMLKFSRRPKSEWTTRNVIEKTGKTL